MPITDPTQRRWRPSRLGALLNLSRRWTIQIREGFVEHVTARRADRMALVELVRVETRAGRFWSRVVLVGNTSRWSVRGISNAAAREMARSLRRASTLARIEVLATGAGPFSGWVDRIERTFDLEHWVTRRETRRLWEGRPTRSEIGFDLEALARDLDDYPDLAFGLDEKRLAALMLTESGLVARVDAHDRAFVERESGRFESYFRTVEKAPLSREQIAS